LILQSIDNDFVSKDYIDEDNLPNNLWIERNKVEQRNEAFLKYFVLDNDEI